MSDSASTYFFPVMGHNRLDYPNASYVTDNWSSISDSVSFRHNITGESLVSHFLAEKKARFGCVVVMRETMYRRTFMAPNNGELSVEQTVNIEEDYRRSAPPKFFPVVVYVGGDCKIIGEKSMGLDELWIGQEFALYKGAILARDHWHFSKSGMGKLLRLREDSTMPKGTMKVSAVAAESGYFSVHVAPNLYWEIKRAPSQGREAPLKCRHRDSILTHALDAGFADLAKRFKAEKEEFATCENFQNIKQILESKKEYTWEDGENFDSCRAACVYLPHSITPDSGRGDDNG